MRRILFLLCFLSTFAAFSQGGPKVDVIKFRGEVTTTVRNTFNVPVGETWLVWNVTTSQLEIGDENEAWTALSDGVNWSDPVNANIVPDASLTRNLGSLSFPFNQLYIGSVIASQGITSPDITVNGSNAYISLGPTDTLGPLSEGTIYADDSENRLKYYDGTTWKAFLLDGDAVTGTDVSLTDAGAYFTTDNVEAALQEIGADLTAVEGDVLEDNNITLPSSTSRYVDIPASSDFVFRLGGLTDVFTIDGAGAMSFGTHTPTLPTNPYGAGWNGSLGAANEDAVYDEMETKVTGTISGRTSVTAVTEIGTQTMANYLSDGVPSAGQWVGISDATPEYLTTSATFNFALLDEYNYDDSATDAATITFSNMGEGQKVRIKYNRASAPTYSGETPTQLPNTFSAGSWPANDDVEAVYYKRYGTVYYFFKEL